MARSKKGFCGSLEPEIDSFRACRCFQLQGVSAGVRGCHAEETASNSAAEHLAHVQAFGVTLAWLRRTLP